MAKRHERTRARRAALQALYAGEITDQSPTAIAERGDALVDEGSLPEYALTLVRGIESHQIAIDDHLAVTSENWSLARMPIVDRSILRLATFEMMYVEDVPTSVSINEAVELAKDFGGDEESPRFVNGVLGRIAKRLDGEDEAGEGADEAPASSVGPQPEVEEASEAAAADGAEQALQDDGAADAQEAVAVEEPEGAPHGA